MLLNDFYTILDCDASDAGAMRVRLALNPEHAIFRGHFPGNPVVPGVCMVQMLKEILATVLKKELQLSSAKSVKFLLAINPAIDRELDLEISAKIDEDSVSAKAQFKKDDKNFFKMSGIYKIVK